jgi:hypothetical protein
MQKLLCEFWQADPLETLPQFFERRIGGYESGFRSHRQRRRKAVPVAKLVLVFHLCRAKGLRSVCFNHLHIGLGNKDRLGWAWNGSGGESSGK